MPGDHRGDADDPGPNRFRLPPPPPVFMPVTSSGAVDQPGVNDKIMRQHHRDNPRLIHPEPMMRELRQPQVFEVFDALLAPAPATVGAVQALGLAGKVGHKQPHPTTVDVRDRQLRTGCGVFGFHDHPHPSRIVIQVDADLRWALRRPGLDASGDIGDKPSDQCRRRAVRAQDMGFRFLACGGSDNPDRIASAKAHQVTMPQGLNVLDESFRPAASIRPDQQPPAPGLAVGVIRQDIQGCVEDIEVIGDGVRPGFAGAQLDGQYFPAVVIIEVDECAQRVEAEVFLPCR